jgi:aminopeptidase-like protein|tara:strand:+ start:4612 stop:5883 length:1272 start_codon:yes stop_codon:yes gene_type:complete
MKKLLNTLFPICRSITGKGFLDSLKIIKKDIPEIKIKSFRSGKKVFDWKIPQEWNVKDAFIKNDKGKKIIDFKKNNLHLVSYSTPVKNKILSIKELKSRIHSIPTQPNVIPYITSYYKKYWGFCLDHDTKKKLFKEKNKKFIINIDTRFKKNGKMNYGECYIEGKSKKEILISTYLCHPSMANNELSGPIVWKYLIGYFKKKINKYSIRFVILPETIGSIAYLSKNHKILKKNIIGGYVLTCLGDKGGFSYLNTKDDDTLSNLIVDRYFTKKKITYKKYTYLYRGSDERQYNSPGIDLPIGSIMRSKYATFPEYHTSADNLKFVKPKYLMRSFTVIRDIINEFMSTKIPITTVMCEPHLSKHNLYPTLSTKMIDLNSRNILNFLSYCDGKKDLVIIAKKINLKLSEAFKIYKVLKNKKIIKEI